MHQIFWIHRIDSKLVYGLQRSRMPQCERELTSSSPSPTRLHGHGNESHHHPLRPVARRRKEQIPSTYADDSFVCPQRLLCSSFFSCKRVITSLGCYSVPNSPTHGRGDVRLTWRTGATPKPTCRAFILTKTFSRFGRRNYDNICSTHARSVFVCSHVDILLPSARYPTPSLLALRHTMNRRLIMYAVRFFLILDTDKLGIDTALAT